MDHLPPSLLILRTLPHTFSKAITTSLCPCCAAQCNGVTPSRSATFTSARCASKASTMARCPLRLARCKAVMPAKSWKERTPLGEHS